MATTQTTQTAEKVSIGQRIFGLHVILLLLLGVAVGFVAKFFAGASSGAYDAHAINAGDTAWVWSEARTWLV
jgi:hypothetical protein